MCDLLLLRMEHFNDWDLQAVVRSCSFSHPAEPEEPAGPPRGEVPAAREAEVEEHRERAPEVARGSARAAVAGKGDSLYDLEYLDLDHKPPLLSTSSQARARARAAGDDGHEVMISFPGAAAASTPGMQPRMPPGRKPGIRTPRPKRSKKSQVKKAVCEVPVADGGVSSDLWAWRKYGQKPIKGSPYPRGYYKCSSMKGCMARKMVERSPAKPGVLIVTYMAEHCHPVPTQLNALAGTKRQKSTTAEDHPATSPKSHEDDPVDRAGGNAGKTVKCEDDSNETSTMAVDGGTEEAAADDENEFWPAGMGLDEFLAPVDDDFDHVFEDGGSRYSL